MDKQTPPTIVYIITKLELGGAQKVCLRLFDDLAKHDHHTWLITGDQGPLVEQVNHNPHAILLDCMTREVSAYGLLREFKTFFTLINVLRKLKKEHPKLIVHTHSTKAGLLGRWAAFFAGIAHRVHTIHGYGFHPHQSRVAWLAVYLSELVTSFITTRFICVSRADAQTGVRLFPGFAHKHTLIYAAIDGEPFLAQATKKCAPTAEPFVIGTVACFKPQKNMGDLLRAFKSVHERYPQARLELIGDGALRPAIEAWLSKNNLTRAVVLHGWQPDVAAITKNWHVFALTSLWEGLPCAVIEARLLKLPVVSYKTGGIPEVIIHNVNGLLYEQKNWHGIADGIGDLIENPALYARLSHYPDQLTPFTYEYMVEQHINMYHTLS